MCVHGHIYARNGSIDNRTWKASATVHIWKRRVAGFLVNRLGSTIFELNCHAFIAQFHQEADELHICTVDDGRLERRLVNFSLD